MTGALLRALSFDCAKCTERQRNSGHRVPGVPEVPGFAKGQRHIGGRYAGFYPLLTRRGLRMDASGGERFGAQSRRPVVRSITEEWGRA